MHCDAFEILTRERRDTTICIVELEDIDRAKGYMRPFCTSTSARSKFTVNAIPLVSTAPIVYPTSLHRFWPPIGQLASRYIQNEKLCAKMIIHSLNKSQSVLM